MENSVETSANPIGANNTSSGRFKFNIDRPKEITLLILVLAAAGLAGIYFAAKNIEPADLKVGEIGDSMKGRLVRVSGVIGYIRKSTSNNMYWTVSDVDDGSNITVPILDGKFKKLAAKRGDAVEIVGIVTEYNGELEIMPKEVYLR